MPIKHAAVRQLRKDRKRSLRNQAVRSELKTLKKRLNELLTAKRQEEARTLLPLLMRRFDQAAAKGIIHTNTASRTKSRLMRRTTPPPTLPAPPEGSPSPS